VVWTTPVTGVYTSAYGTLTINIGPAEAVAAGERSFLWTRCHWFDAGSFIVDVAEYHDLVSSPWTASRRRKRRRLRFVARRREPW
jgi:hypothetical protein